MWDYFFYIFILFFLKKQYRTTLFPKIAPFILWFALLKSSCLWDCKNELVPPYCHKTTLCILPLPWRTPLLSWAIVVGFPVSCAAGSWKAPELRCCTTNMMASLKETKINFLKWPCQRAVSVLSRSLAFSVLCHHDEKLTAACKGQNGLWGWWWWGELLSSPHLMCLDNCKVFGSWKRRTL